MPSTAWQGRMVFNSNTDRDKAGKKIEDAIQATLGVVPHPDGNYTTDPSGVEYRNNMVIETDSGPGFIFSARFEESETMAAAMAAVSDGIMNEAATLNGYGGQFSIPE